MRRKYERSTGCWRRTPGIARVGVRLALAGVLLACTAATVCAQQPVKHWSLIKPRSPDIPEVRDTDHIRGPIDKFIRARLEAADLRAAPPADRRTLIRRVSLDLTGILPSPAEVRGFVADDRADSYERLVDRLLRSPHFGERQARHWLDAARYADSHGFSIDGSRSIWPWRDYVIQAFNEDMPFDRFVIEQMAGDLLENATDTQRIATGFHRNTMINQEGGVDREEFRIESVKDRVATTATVFLGLTLTCAQCHDHKSDPLSQKDFYRFYAFLNNDDEPSLTVGEPEARQRLAAWQQRDRQLGRAIGRTEEPREKKRLQQERKRHKRKQPRLPSTMVLAARQRPRTSHLHTKGDFTRKAEVVKPGVPAALHPLRTESAAPTRLDLARWLVSKDNPLIARVTINRIWQQYFGRGIVPTENDFGTQGEPPTHPKLLDWLAAEFMAGGWRQKRMHKLIVMSSTYRQSSRMQPGSTDVANRLLGRQTRLRVDAEIIRDSALVASGLLSRKIGGPSVRPPQPGGVMNLGQQNKRWTASRGEDRYRRGMYTFFWRATPHPALTVFDAPNAVSSCTRRFRSNTPLQALTLLNDPAFSEMASALGARIQSEAPDDDGARIRHAFEICLGRPPRPREVEVFVKLLAREPDRTQRWRAVARVLMNLDEFITRG